MSIRGLDPTDLTLVHGRLILGTDGLYFIHGWDASRPIPRGGLAGQLIVAIANAESIKETGTLQREAARQLAAIRRLPPRQQVASMPGSIHVPRSDIDRASRSWPTRLAVTTASEGAEHRFTVPAAARRVVKAWVAAVDPTSHRRELGRVVLGALGVATLLGALLVLIWPKPVVPEPPTIAAAVVDRRAPLLLQPILAWADGSRSASGTGFVLHHHGRTFAVTSSHFVAPSPQPLIAVGLGSLTKLEVLGETYTSWGSIGPAKRAAQWDFGDDYLVMPIDPLPGLQGLELDPRPVVASGLRVWFPDKRFETESGFVVRKGKIKHSTTHLLEVELDEPMTIESQSGSPVLDEEGNRVLGILFGGEGKQLYFTPASALRRVLEDPTRQPVPLEQALPHWASTARH